MTIPTAPAPRRIPGRKTACLLARQESRPDFVLAGEPPMRAAGALENSATSPTREFHSPFGKGKPKATLHANERLEAKQAAEAAIAKIEAAIASLPLHDSLRGGNGHVLSQVKKLRRNSRSSN